MRTLRTACLAAAVMACTALPAPAQEQAHRQLGAHVHGHGRLNIAVEGKKLSMELEVPGADIVGFEHEPSTPEQRAAIDEARAKLANGLFLIAPPQQGGCQLEYVKVTAESGHKHDDGAPGAGPEADAGHDHSEFRANYTARCASPSRVTSLTFEFFNVFPNSQELAIAIVTAKGQTSHAVTRENPSLDLPGGL
jgi:Protein of unknown function (DUF2796)